MSSLGLPEILVILALGLLLFGSRLPSVGKSLGQGIRNFKKGLTEVDPENTESQPPPAKSQPAQAPAQHTQTPPQPVLAQNVLPTSLEGTPQAANQAVAASRAPKSAVVDVEHGDEHK